MAPSVAGNFKKPTQSGNNEVASVYVCVCVSEWERVYMRVYIVHDTALHCRRWMKERRSQYACKCHMAIRCEALSRSIQEDLCHLPCLVIVQHWPSHTQCTCVLAYLWVGDTGQMSCDSMACFHLYFRGWTRVSFAFLWSNKEQNTKRVIEKWYYYWLSYCVGVK